MKYGHYILAIVLTAAGLAALDYLRPRPEPTAERVAQYTCRHAIVTGNYAQARNCG